VFNLTVEVMLEM